MNRQRFHMLQCRRLHRRSDAEQGDGFQHRNGLLAPSGKTTQLL